MKVLEENNITAFDVDSTLLLWSKEPNIEKPGTKPFHYGNEVIYLYPHKPHIRFLKHCSVRGDYVSVWSQNGFAWAEQVVLALGLEDYVDEVRSKPVRHVDDKETLEDIVGNRIFMPYNPEGKE